MIASLVEVDFVMSLKRPLFLALIFLLSTFAGCFGSDSETDSDTDSDSDIESESDIPPITEVENTTDEPPVVEVPSNQITCADGSTELWVWGNLTCLEPEMYAASDVSNESINLTLEWYNIAREEWGNYGPVELYIVGLDLDAALELEDAYCERHKALDSAWSEEWDCANENYQIFSHYVEDGGAAVGTFKRDYLEYDFLMLTMTSKYPGPEEEDYKPVVLHEYFHIYQHAHISDECSSDNRVACERDSKMGGKGTPWFSEGGAEFMAQLLYSRQPDTRDNYFEEVMRWKLEQSIDGYKNQDVGLENLTYSSPVGVYDIGAWFIAYLVHNEGEETFLVDFYGDLDELGFEGSFVKHFNSSSADYIDDFDAFLDQPVEDILQILPESDQS